MRVEQAHTVRTDALEAVADLQAKLGAPTSGLLLFFCSSSYDLTQLGPAFASIFSGVVAGCTSAGQLGSRGYVRGGITAVNLVSPALRATPYLISSVDESAEATEVGYRAMAALARDSSRRAVGLLLIDGSSGAEERITGALFEALGDVPLVGGTAASDAANTCPAVYCDGEFRRGAAVFVLLETTLPFATFRVQHVVAGQKKLVITEADAGARIVREINGKPAAAEYARALGIEPEALEPGICNERPLLWSVGGQQLVRAIRSINPDGSLSFFCAVEAGLVLSVGESAPALPLLRDGFDRGKQRVPSVAVVVGFDSSLRRQQLEKRGEVGAVGEFLASEKVVGFSTNGEQFDSLHLNQTFTALVLGDTPR